MKRFAHFQKLLHNNQFMNDCMASWLIRFPPFIVVSALLPMADGAPVNHAIFYPHLTQLNHNFETVTEGLLKGG
jgi:hypothetical protein